MGHGVCPCSEVLDLAGWASVVFRQIRGGTRTGNRERQGTSVPRPCAFSLAQGWDSTILAHTLFSAILSES
jgi:hypothetical protein